MLSWPRSRDAATPCVRLLSRRLNSALGPRTWVGELVLKAGVHAGACLAVEVNDRLDFFGGAVNTAARIQGVSRGNDVVVTNKAIADIEAEQNGQERSFHIEDSFDAQLCGLAEPVRVHRLIASPAIEVAKMASSRSVGSRLLGINET